MFWWAGPCSVNLQSSSLLVGVRGYVPSLLFTWGQTMVKVMRIMVTSFKKPHAHVAPLSAPNPASGHCQPAPLMETPGHSQASLGQSLVGSLLLPPGSWCAKGSVCALPESISLCTFWQLCGRLMATSPRGLMPYPGLLRPEPLPLWQSTADPYLHRRHSNTVLSQCLWGLWVLVHARFVWAL